MTSRSARPLNPVRAALCALIVACAWMAAPIAATAQQSLFDTVARVNDSVVTRFEVIQRARLLGVLRRPDASPAAAFEDLIDDRLKEQAARSAGIIPTQEDIRFGIEEFAARANLTGEELLIAVSEVGIEPETVRDYIATLISWGEVVRERFTARARPSDAEIDRAVALGLDSGSTRVSQNARPGGSRGCVRVRHTAVCRRRGDHASQTDRGELDQHPLGRPTAFLLERRVCPVHR